MVFVILLVMGQPIIKALALDNDVAITLIETDSDSDSDSEENKNNDVEESKEEKITSPSNAIKISESTVGNRKMLHHNKEVFSSVYMEINIPPPELS